YPWDGHVTLKIDPGAASSRFAVNVRVPGWARNQVMPGDLYRFADKNAERVSVSVNGQPVNVTVVNGFAKIDREWRAGDVVNVDMPMPVRRVVADARVRDDVGRIALERGPLVYAAEWPDNGGHALNIVVPDTAPLSSEFRPALLGGVQVITGAVQALASRDAGGARRTQSHQLIAIPYFAWSNRG